MSWQFIDATGRVAFRINPDGSVESALVEALPPDVVPLPAPVPTLADNIAAAVLKIDADADAIRFLVIGYRATEYQTANDEATAFKKAGYTGAIPPSVQCWVDAKAAGGVMWTAQQAADDILATAAQWLSAQSAIRANRLKCKEQAKAAADAAGVNTALANWAGFVFAIRSQLGLPAA